MADDKPVVMHRCRVYSPTKGNKKRYCFGVLVPGTESSSRTVILDGKARRIVQADKRDITIA